ncbi:MAG: hypothetical protein NTW87_10680 [Planctomycetota bacterium]|nr:hypothetical protein [Planctomycetota bacterium]
MATQLMLRPGQRAWLKAWGKRDDWIDENDVLFTNKREKLNFARRPASLAIGDIIVVYAVGWGNLLAVTEAIGEPERMTDAELRRWPWSVEVRNLVPGLGSKWRDNGLILFALRDTFIERHPNAGVSQWGSNNFHGIQGGHMRLSRRFGGYLLHAVSASGATVVR